MPHQLEWNMDELIEALKLQFFLSPPTPISFPNKIYTSFLPPQKTKKFQLLCWVSNKISLSIIRHTSQREQEKRSGKRLKPDLTYGHRQ